MQVWGNTQPYECKTIYTKPPPTLLVVKNALVIFFFSLKFRSFDRCERVLGLRVTKRSQAINFRLGGRSAVWSSSSRHVKDRWAICSGQRRTGTMDALTRSFPTYVRATVRSTAVRTTAVSCSQNLEQLRQSALGTRPVRVALNSTSRRSSKSVNSLLRWATDR